jgi:cytoskeleton protein RodZ
VQLRKTMSNGESIGASGSLPLSVVVGRADVTDVSVKGKTFSLAGIAKDNVARFEVK